MSQTSVAEFLAAVKQDEGLKQKLKAAIDDQSCVKVGEQSGYKFTPEELHAELSKMPQEELAEIVNPGVAPRRHIEPR